MNNTTVSTEQLTEDYPEIKIAQKIWKYIPPIIIAIGDVSNVLAIVVMLRRRMQKSTTMFYLTILIFMDIAVLNTNLLCYWLENAHDVQVGAYSAMSCKVYKFWMYFSTDFCNWMLVAVTVDRCVAVCLPFKARIYCKKKTARLVVLIIGAAMFVANFHLFWGITIEQNLETKYCTVGNSFTLLVWPWLDFCLYSLFPFVIIVVCNGCIIRKALLAQNKILAHSMSQPNNADEIPKIQIISNAKSNKDSRLSKRKRISNITKMLQAFNVSFFVLAMPITIWLILYNSKIQYEDSLHINGIVILVQSVVTMLEFLNNAIHFFLCLMGSAFRRELKSLFQRKPTLVTEQTYCTNITE